MAARGKTSARNAALEATIIDNPESPDAYLVYGDWLLEQGDPLGELVAVQAALARNKGRDVLLKRREKRLLAEYKKSSLGNLAELEHTWSLGFLEGITLSPPTRERYRELREHVAARFLRELDIELFDVWETASSNREIVEALAELGVPQTLRKLAFVNDHDNPNANLGDVSIVWPELARIRELTVCAATVSLGMLDFPILETMALTTRPDEGIVESLVDARWPKLRSLSLSFAGANDVDLPYEALAKILEALGPVEHLGVADHFVGDAIVAAIGKWRHLSSLKSLDLSRTALTEQGVRVLLDRKAAFERLESIDLRENELEASTCTALEKAFELAVDTDGQGDRERYDEIAE